MVYNMGTEDHPIGELSVNVSDHQYHVVRFTRSGPNSTIQIDDHNVRTKQPTGNNCYIYITLRLLIYYVFYKIINLKNSKITKNVYFFIIQN